MSYIVVPEVILAILLIINATIGLSHYSVIVNYVGVAPHFGLTSGGYFYVLTPTNITNISAINASYLLFNSTYVLVNPLSITNGSELIVSYLNGKACFTFRELKESLPAQGQDNITLPLPKLNYSEKSGIDPNEIEIITVLILALLAMTLVRALGRSRRRA